ncbi:MAG: GHKL domain-containing protein [Eubacteriales bacterium]|nr:GHKL domain-containing protein [Eubacteriales bacterium]
MKLVSEFIIIKEGDFPEVINILIYLMNALTYLVPLLNFLPFKISFFKKAELYLIILGNILLMVYYTGNSGVVLLILSVSSYLFFIDTNRLRNICIFFVSYLFCALWDSLFTLIWNMMGYPIAEGLKQNLLLYLIYNIIYNLLLYFFSRSISIIIKKSFKLKNKWEIPQKVWISIGINLLICITIFIFNIIVGEHIGYNKKTIMFNCILFGLYLLISFILTVNSINAYIIKSNIQFKQNAYDTLQKYTQQIENMYASVRSFKHDYINIMTSMSGYIQNKDLDGLSNYFNQSILPLSLKITNSNYKLNQLMNIKVLEIKSIISAKIIYAYEIGIKVTIEIMEPIESFSMDTIDLARVLGIFLDNAIEAALETNNPELSLVMINNSNSVAIIISNNYINYNIPYYKLKKASISTKGKNRGIGLHNASTIISEYPNIFHDTEIKENIFIQHLEIFKHDNIH